jgi:hypothetical protein
MSKYGMTVEEYTAFKLEAQFEKPESWVTYGWHDPFEGKPQTKNFPNEKIAKAYFSTIKETNFYQV